LPQLAPDWHIVSLKTGFSLKITLFDLYSIVHPHWWLPFCQVSQIQWRSRLTFRNASFYSRVLTCTCSVLTWKVHGL